jgi:membrane-associated HD superfamily phosphohydrolase
LARWPSPRYQALVTLFSAFVYVGLHLATVTNLDYTSDTPFAFEYAYYVFVVSDLLLELFALLSHPIIYLKKPSSYLSLTAIGLLTASVITRFIALVIFDNFLDQHALLTTSFFLLIFATPLMFFRLLSSWSADRLSWNVAKTNHIVTQCIVNSLWVFALSLLVIFSFWVTLGALQYDDIKPLNMLGLLTLGALQ